MKQLFFFIIEAPTSRPGLRPSAESTPMPKEKKEDEKKMGGKAVPKKKLFNPSSMVLRSRKKKP